MNAWLHGTGLSAKTVSYAADISNDEHINMKGARALDKQLNDSWARDAVFIRLTKRRKIKLMAIAKDMDESSTPSDAIERAIDLASGGSYAIDASDNPVLDRLAILQEVIDQLFIEQRANLERNEARMSEAIRNSKAAFDLLAAAAARPEPDEWEDE